MKSFLAAAFLYLQALPLSCFAERLIYSSVTARLPSPRSAVATIYDGQDNIYLLGGAAEGSSGLSEILKYSISTDRIQQVGNLPSGAMFENSNRVSMNSDGIIHVYQSALGGGDGLPIFEYNPTTNESRLAFKADGTFAYFASAQTQSDKVVILNHFSGDSFEFDLNTFDLISLDYIESSNLLYFYTVFDDEERIMYSVAQISGEEHMAYTKYVVESTAVEIIKELPSTLFIHGSVWANGKMYSIDYVNEDGGWNGLIAFDPFSLEYTFLPVEEMDNNFGASLAKGSVYVEGLNRIYLFGGYNGTYTDNIAFISFEMDEPTTTAQT